MAPATALAHSPTDPVTAASELPAPDLSGGLREFLSYWRGKRGDRPAPLRCELDVLADLPRLASHAFVLEALPDGNFRYRLVGSAIVRTLKRDATNQIVGPELYGPASEALLRAMRTALVTGTPHLTRHTLTWGSGSAAAVGMLFCPVSSDGVAVDQLVGLARLRPMVPRPGPQSGPVLRLELSQPLHE